MRKAIGLLCLLFVLFPALPGRAALQFDVMPGYEGTIREAAWFPITCEIFNDGPSFNAVIEVSSGQFSAEQVRHVPVELPTNTRKRIVIPMFASEAARFGLTPTWNGRLLDENGKPVRGVDTRSSQTRVVSLDSMVMGALPRTFGGSPVFPEIKSSRPDLKPEVARFTIDQFPDNPITLEGLGAFYLSSEKAVDLKVNQVTALLAWVRAGGHLIVAVEQIADITGTAWLRQFLPIELADARNLTFGQEVIDWIRGQPSEESRPAGRRGRRAAPPETGGYAELSLEGSLDAVELPVAVGSLRDGRILFSAGNVPLAVQAPRGRGQISLLTFSPEREPFRSWKNRGFFWAKVCGMPAEFFNATENTGWGGSSVDAVFGALIDSRQIKKLPVGWLLLLLVVYLVVIGPFDQWWLKKIGKQMLTWITFPAYVVLFSLLIYFIGYKLRAGETEWNELNIVDVLPRGDNADLRGRTYLSIYSSANATYPITGQAGFATLRPELADFRGAPKNDRLKVVQQGNSFKAEVSVPVWTSLLYVNEWIKTNDTPFVAAVSEAGLAYELEIENLLPRPLDAVRVVAGQTLFELDPLPANARRVIRLEPAQGRNIRQFARENGAYFQAAAAARRSQFGAAEGGRLEDRPLTAVTASLLSYLDDQPGRVFVTPPGLDLTPQIARGDAVIFAWLPKFSFGEKINDFQPPRFQQDTLLRLTVPIRKRN